MNPKDQVGAKKAPLDGVPAAAAIFAAPAHAVGHLKYGPFNWREQPVQAMTYIGAIQRHIAAWVDGQDLAEDTGVHHLAHAMASMNILADAMGMGNLLDNRPPKGPAADMLRAQDKSISVSSDADPTTLGFMSQINRMAQEQVRSELLLPLRLRACPACGHFIKHLERNGQAWCEVCMDEVTDGDPRQVGPCY